MTSTAGSQGLARLGGLSTNSNWASARTRGSSQAMYSPSFSHIACWLSEVLTYGLGGLVL